MCSTAGSASLLIGGSVVARTHNVQAQARWRRVFANYETSIAYPKSVLPNERTSIGPTLVLSSEGSEHPAST
jgi:hypothetical protein